MTYMCLKIRAVNREKSNTYMSVKLFYGLITKSIYAEES